MKLIANSCLTLFFSFLFLNTFALTPENESYFEFRTMQRVRIDFEGPNGYVRPLLLGFTTDNAATDGVDYGYDGLNFDQFPNDMFWMIENNSYVIQGVGEFDVTKQYPLGLFLENSGTIKISLNSLENFDTDIAVYVYDSLLGTYTAINDSNFNLDMTSGDYVNRFFIAFIDGNTSEEEVTSVLSIEDFHSNDTYITYLSDYNELVIKSNSIITHVDIFSITGQKLYTVNHLNSSDIKISLNQSFNSYGIVKAYSQENLQSKLIRLN